MLPGESVFPCVLVYIPLLSWYIGIMSTLAFPKLDKTAIQITSLTDSSGEKEYWLTKSPAERLEALETMRQIIYGYDPLTTRLQRFFEVTKRA